MRKDSDNAKLLEPGELPSKRKVLVVEDNELNRDILSSFLEEKFDVFLAENGEEGLELLSEHYRELSVVLLDICMPVCDGFEFLRRRNTDKFLSTIPVIVMTGSFFIRFSRTLFNLVLLEVSFVLESGCKGSTFSIISKTFAGKMLIFIMLLTLLYIHDLKMWAYTL